LADGTLLLACGVDHETSSLCLRQAAANPKAVKAFVGVHPSEATTDVALDWLEVALGEATGLGEVGLDPKYSQIGAGSRQLGAFQDQLEAASKKLKPIQVHSRGAEKECLEALAGFTLGPVLMHWFQGEGMLSKAMGEGYYVSFGPALLYSRKLQRMAERCDKSQVVVETDSPVAYGPLGGARGPSLVPSVVFKLADVWGKGFEETRGITTGNALRYLGAAEKG